jgi:hypothetical protein
MAWFMSKLSMIFPIRMERIYQPMQGNWVARFEYSNTDELFDLKVDNSISIQNDDLNLIYVGFIRSKISNVDTTYIVATGRSMNNKPKVPMQLLNTPVSTITNLLSKYSNPTEMLELATELNYNALNANDMLWATDLYAEGLVAEDFIDVYNDGSITSNVTGLTTGNGVQENSAALENNELSVKSLSTISTMSRTQLQQLSDLQVAVAQNSKGTMVLGKSNLSFNLDYHKTIAISSGANYLELPLQSFDFIFNNIKAIEYTENTTIIWL